VYLLDKLNSVFTFIKEFAMSSGKLVYSINVSPIVDRDVVNRRLSVYVNGSLTEEKLYPPTTTNFGNFGFNHNDIVKVLVADIDDAGNASEPIVSEFTALDTVPPQKPTYINIDFVKEDYDS
jgi:hypothetical protein